MKKTITHYAGLALMVIGLAICHLPAQAQTTSSGIDTASGNNDLVVGAGGQQIGDWNKSRLNVIGTVISKGLLVVPDPTNPPTCPDTPSITGALIYVPPQSSTVDGYYELCTSTGWVKVGGSGAIYYPTCNGTPFCYWGYGGTQDANGLNTANKICQMAGYSSAIQSVASGGGCNGCNYQTWTGSAWSGGSGCNGCEAVAAVSCQ